MPDLSDSSWMWLMPSSLLLVHQFGHAFLQGLLVDLVGNLVNDDGLPLTLVNVLEMALGAHYDTAAAGAVAVFHALGSVNGAGQWGSRVPE
jgi:hypothetical protein